MNGKGIFITSKIIGGLLAFFFLCVIASHDKNIQKMISTAVAGQIDSVIDGKLSFSSILLSPYGALILKDVLVLDPAPYTADTHGKGYATTDTLFYAGSITASFNLAGLFKGEGVHLGRVKIKDGGLFIVNEPSGERGRRNNMEVLIKPKDIDSSFVAQPGPDLFDIRRVNISGFRFRLVDFAKETEKAYEGFGINFEDMDLRVNLRAHNLKFAGGRMSGSVDHLDAVEKSGYSVDEITGDAISGLGKTEISDLYVRDALSTVRLKYLNFTFKNITYFRDFVNKVSLDGELARSTVAMNSVNWFSKGNLQGNDLVFEVSKGQFSGPVNNLDVSGLRFAEKLSGISGTAQAKVGDVVPDVNRLTLDAKVTDCNFNSGQISVFLTNWARKNGKEVDLSKLAPKERLGASLFCKGNVNDLDIGADLEGASFGSLHFKGNVKEAYRKLTPIAVSGTIRADSLHLGRTIGNESLGEMDGNGSMDIVLDNPLQFTLDSLVIDRLTAFNYTFRDIDARGKLEDNTVSAQLVSRDTALTTNMFALLDLKPFDGKRRIQFGATIDNADLHALGMDSRGSASGFKAVLYSNLVGDGEYLLGDAFIDNLNVDYGNGMSELGDITLRAFKRDGEQFLLFKSPFVDIDYSGTGYLYDFPEAMQDATIRKHLPTLAGKGPQKECRDDFSLNVDFHDSRQLMKYMLPKLYIADSTSLRLSAHGGVVSADIRSPRVAFGTRFAKRLQVSLSNDTTALDSHITMDELNAGGIVMHGPVISAKAAGDSATVNVDYDNINGSDSYGKHCLDTRFERDENGVLSILATTRGSFFGSGSDKWTISDSPISIKGKDFRVDDLRIENGLQSIRLDGAYSLNETDTLGLYLNKLDLNLIDQFLSEKLGIRGITTGQALITSPISTSLGMLVNIGCDSLAIGGTEAGTFNISSHWDENGEMICGQLKNTLDGRDRFIAEGNYKPVGKEFQAKADFDDFPLGVSAPLLSKVFSEMAGYLSGSISLGGKRKGDVSVVSRGIQLEDARIRLGSTGASYTLNGPIKVDDNGIRLEKIDIRDDHNGKGSLSCTVAHDQLRKLSLDASATLRDLDMIDLPEGQSMSGLVKANGSLKVNGPLSSLTIDADLVTSNEGSVHIPLSGALSSSSSDLLTFVEPARELDPYEQMIIEQSNKDETERVKTDFRAKGRIRLTPGIKAFMEINKSSGNVLTVSGTGDVGFELQPLRNHYNLNGMYMIDKGNYHFVLPGILEKDFDIQNGSFVKFGGDVADTELDISTIYQARTSLTTLISDSTIIATRRLVNCGLDISGKLSNPSIKFSVSVPDLDPTTKSKVDGALNTEDKVQKQFVALLLFGSFLPSEQSGVFNQNNILYSNIGEVVSSQINSIFQKLDIPLDIGLGYQETNTGNNAFDVAVSTQLFNNRVVVNGSVGNRKYSTGAATTNGDIVGDIDIEFKLDKEGKFRLNAFSHSADQYTSYLDNSQRNGIGASYQQEYNSFGEFWRNLFRRRQKKAEGPEEEEQDTDREEAADNVIIKIENDKRKAVSDTLDLR